VRLTCQEQLLPGDTLQDKWDAAQRLGYDGIELRGHGEHRLRERLPDLHRARRDGVVMRTVCVDMAHFIGAFDPELRRDAVANLRTQLSVIAEIGGTSAMTPASYGMFSRRLPPFVPPRTPDGDREVLLDALGELGRHAQAEGVAILLEPLNRYEDHMVNRLAQAVELAEATGLDSVGVVADSYHMNIEETDPAVALVAAAGRLAHVQVSDSNRLEPGAGHLDWSAFLEALERIGYSGDLAVECRLSEPAEKALASAADTLRGVLSHV
jgi:sugar phosphate isomerase/epimerase